MALVFDKLLYIQLPNQWTQLEMKCYDSWTHTYTHPLIFFFFFFKLLREKAKTKKIIKNKHKKNAITKMKKKWRKKPEW